MMKEGGVSHQGNEFHPYANGNMQHMYNNSRQTPDSGLGNEELRNSMNNAGGGGENSGAPGAGGAPPGFQPNPYYVGNAQQSQYNEQHQQPYRHKQYSGGQQEGGRFERSTGPPSIVTMHTSPPNMEQEGAPSYNPNFGYSQYSNQGGQQYGGMDRNFNPPHQMAARSHSNYSESSSSTLNMAAGGPPDPSVLSGQPLMAGPHGGMMYAPQGAQMGPPYGHPQMQQQMQQGGGPPFMFNPAAHAAAMANQQMMQGGQMGQQQGGPAGMHPQGIPMQSQQGPGGMPPGPPQSASPPHPGMMMVPMGQHGGPIHPGQTVYYQHQAMMAQRGPVVAQGPEGFVQFTYPTHPHPAAAAQHQGGFPMRGPMLQHQRSLNSPAPSDNTDGQSVHGGAPSIGMWNGPPDQQSQQSSPPGGMQPMQPMQPGMMVMQPHPMMAASFPGAGGVPFGNPGPGPRMVPGTMGPVPPYVAHPQQLQQMAMQQAMLQSQGMQQMHPQFAAGGFPQQQPQPQSGYWQGPTQGGRGAYRGNRGGRGGGGGYGGNRPNSRQQYNSRNNSITSGGRGREAEESSKCTTPTDEDIISDMSHQMDSLRMGEESGEGGHLAPSNMPHKQLLELADTKSSSPPAEPHPSEDECVVVQQEMQLQQEGTAAAPVPTTPRAEPRKELLEMKKTPKHQTEKSISQSIPVDPVPPHGAAVAAPTRTWSEVAKRACVFCRGKEYPEEEYSSHTLRGPNNEVTCPRFRETGCSYCETKGELAHDKFFCPKRLADMPAAEEQNAAAAASHGGYATHAPPPSHQGEREGQYRGGQKRGGGGGGGGGHYNNRGRGGGGGYGGERKYDNRR